MHEILSLSQAIRHKPKIARSRGRKRNSGANSLCERTDSHRTRDGEKSTHMFLKKFQGRPAATMSTMAVAIVERMINTTITAAASKATAFASNGKSFALKSLA